MILAFKFVKNVSLLIYQIFGNLFHHFLIINLSFTADTEFRITIDPNGRIAAESPTVHCTPDLTRTPRKSARKQIILRAPSPELKAVWQNLLQRQV